ncbi:glycosyltransferase family 9 protein [candidate division WOR-3 bacterium]|nr:glycosyltransferase family 9 protein [candidate division WOR-3 bacterium]
MKILIINLAAIGDTVLSTVVARELKNKYPDSVISYLVQPLCAGIAELSPYVDEVLTYDKNKTNLKDYLNMVLRLKNKRFDMSLSLNFAMRSSLLAFLIHPKIRLGYDHKKSGIFLTHMVPGERKVIQKEGLNQLQVLKPLGITSFDANPLLVPKKRDLKKVKKLIDKERRTAVICPASSSFFNSLPIEITAKIADCLTRSFTVFAIGSTREKQYLENLREMTEGKVRVFPGSLTIGEAAALLYLSKVLVSIDTGPLHIAQAMDTPVVAVFGPSNPAVWGPHGRNFEVVSLGLECSPCNSKTDCRDKRCLKDINPKRICVIAENLAKKV